MKIEIEYSEVSRLQYQVESLKKEKEELEKKLKSLNQREIKQAGVDLGLKLFHDLNVEVFKSLGFENEYAGYERSVNVDRDVLEPYLGITSRYSPIEGVTTVNLGAIISQKYKTAFLTIGIDTSKFEHKD